MCYTKSSPKSLPTDLNPSSIHKIIFSNQNAFVPNHFTSDCIIVVQEMMHSIRSKRGKCGSFGLKIDISKAYESLEWPFIDNTMAHFSFSETSRSLINQCTGTTSFYININREPTGMISPTRDIRQGCPLSPYLYIMCAEVLTGLIKDSVAKGKIHGLKANSRNPIVTHVLYADDIFIFKKAEESEI